MHWWKKKISLPKLINFSQLTLYPLYNIYWTGAMKQILSRIQLKQVLRMWECSKSNQCNPNVQRLPISMLLLLLLHMVLFLLAAQKPYSDINYIEYAYVLYEHTSFVKYYTRHVFKLCSAAALSFGKSNKQKQKNRKRINMRRKYSHFIRSRIDT